MLASPHTDAVDGVRMLQQILLCKTIIKLLCLLSPTTTTSTCLLEVIVSWQLMPLKRSAATVWFIKHTINAKECYKVLCMNCAEKDTLGLALKSY